MSYWWVFGLFLVIPFIQKEIFIGVSSLILDDVAIDVSVEVVGDAGMDDVSENVWSFVDWCVTIGRDLHKDLDAGPFSTDRSTVVMGSCNGLWVPASAPPPLAPL